MRYQDSDSEFLKSVYYQTKILKKPISGIVSGYHELPYVMVGPQHGKDTGQAVEIRGKIKVSPRLILSPGDLGITYSEVFDPETMDQTLSARVFVFIYTKKDQIKVEHEGFHILVREKNVAALLEEVMDDLAAREIINTSVIETPHPKFYPVSLERFINEILDREFK